MRDKAQQISCFSSLISVKCFCKSDCCCKRKKGGAACHENEESEGQSCEEVDKDPVHEGQLLGEGNQVRDSPEDL